MKKRLLSFCMAAVLLLSLVPLPALAAEYTPTRFRVVSKKTSTLASGVTQEIISTQRTDGKGQNMYYITTADLSRDDVKVYANFADNQWTNYKLQRITEQLAAAKTRHSNPEDTENYIPYYEPVAIFNADFYNMSTGQPNGAFAMEGHIVQAANNSFFAVREDGSAVIGRNRTEWDAFNAESPIQEAVGGSTVLVWDGKIAYTGNDTSIEPRTMVGVTADGKVVLALLDGRQAPFSYGGGMNDIAEMMLLAGCDRAINLDGGGSSGYAARQEGETEVTVVNRPSDGYERDVSSSLMIVSTTPPSDAFVRASLRVENEYLAPGASVPISALGLSSSAAVVDIPVDVTWQVDNGNLGSVTQTGVFTAGQATGDVAVQMVYQNRVVGETVLHVVEPDELVCSLNSLVVPYGETVNFTVKAMYNTDHEVVTPAGAISLSLDQVAQGTLNGTSFTASSDTSAPSKGNLVITCGALTKNIPITLGRASVVLFDFEEDALDAQPESFFWGPASAHLQYNIFTPKWGVVDKNTGRVRSGEHALALQIDWSNITDKGGCTTINLGYRLTEKIDLTDAVGIGAWVWMPDEYKEANFRFNTFTGTGTRITSTNLGRIRESAYEEGCWVYLYQKLNEGSTGAYVSPATVQSNGQLSIPPFIQFELYASATCDPAIKSAAKTFTFYVDDITVDYSPAVPDREAPVFGTVSMSLANGNTPLTRGTVAQCTESRMSFIAAVEDDTTKDNSSGIDPDSAVVTVDGIDVGATYKNGSLISQEVTLAAGVHTVRMAISDAAGNERSVIRQVNVTANADVPTVRVVPHDKALNNLPLGSVYYVDVVATNVEAIQAVDLKLDLNDISTWELEGAAVDSCFDMSYSVQDWHMGDNIATIHLSRLENDGGTDTRTGEIVLASLPIRVWKGDAKWTSSSVGQWPRDVSVEVDLGKITYAADYEQDTHPGFSAARIQADTELNAWGNAVANSKWHVHTAATLEDKTATCTEDGYSGRTYCEGCKSVIEWGEITRGGHAWAALDFSNPSLNGKFHCVRCQALYNGEYTNPTYGNKQYYKDGELYTGWVGDTYYQNGTQQTAEFQMIADVLYRFVDGVCTGQTPYTGVYEGKTYQDGTLANGWIGESWYVDGVKSTGMQKVEDKYYDFGEDGVCADKMPYTGFHTENGERYYIELGVIRTEAGWFSVGDERCHACADKNGALGTVTVNDTRTCTEDGYLFYNCTCGEREMSDPLWAEGHKWDENHVCTVCQTQGRDIANTTVTFAGSPYFVYTGKAIRAAHTVTDGDRTLVVESDRRGKHGLVTYKDNVNIGVATLHIEGRGDYYGVLEANFYIIPADVKELRVQNRTKDSVTLAWDAAPGADYYALYRKPANAPDEDENWTFVKSLYETQLEVTGLTFGEIYTFRIATRTVDPNDPDKLYAGAFWTKVDVDMGHQWDEPIVVEPTCTEDGSSTHTCTICGETETEVLPKLGHDVAEWTVTKQPTIDAPGTKKGHCSRCDQDVEVEVESLTPYQITAAGTTNGKVTVPTKAAEADSVEITVTPDEDYVVDKITVTFEKDGETVTVPVSAENKFNMPAADVTVTVTFKRGYCRITAQSGEGYTVTADPARVEVGGSSTFTVRVNVGWRKTDAFAVKANGTVLTAGEDGKYTITNITQNQTITVEGLTKLPNTYPITLPEPDPGYSVLATKGSVTPTVQGGSYSFSVEIADGYREGSDFAVTANGTPLTADKEGVYTISDIREAQTVKVEGVEEVMYTVTLEKVERCTVTLTPSNGTVKHGGKVSIIVEIDEGYYPGDNFAVLANDRELTANEDGSYTINGITEDQTVTVVNIDEIPMKAETAGPEVSVGEHIDEEVKEEVEDAVTKTEVKNQDVMTKAGNVLKELVEFAKSIIDKFKPDETPGQGKTEEIKVQVSLDIKATDYKPADKGESGNKPGSESAQASLTLDIKPVYKLVKETTDGNGKPTTIPLTDEDGKELKDELKTKSFHDYMDISVPLPTGFFTKRDQQDTSSTKRVIVKHYRANGTEIKEDRQITDATYDLKKDTWKVNFRARSFSEYEVVGNEEAVNVRYEADGIEGYPSEAVLTSSDTDTELPTPKKLSETRKYTDTVSNDVVTVTTEYTFKGWQVDGQGKIYTELTDELFGILKSKAESGSATLTANFEPEESEEREHLQDEEPDNPDPGEPDPDEPKPDEPGPDKPKPDEPKPDEPKPGEPKPDEPKPDEPKPDEPKPDEPGPDKPKPDEPDPSNPGSGPVGGGGGGGGSAGYTVTPPKATPNGTVRVSTNNATPGKTVTITATPAEGYEVGTVTVTDKDGNEIPVTASGGNTYTFTMPKSRVDVEVEFVKKQPVNPDPKPVRFDDVDSNAYYAAAVEWAVRNGITTGTSATTFNPNGTCTRAQMVTFLWRAAGKPAPQSKLNPFTDVSPSEYYYDAVLWAVEKGITKGASETTFNPAGTVTRAQTVTFLYRYANEPSAEAANFTDVAADVYYAPAVNWAAGKGITTGTTGTTFSPDDTCTRAQTVTFLYRDLAG